MSKQQQLDQIAADIVSNNICPDLAKTAKNLVMGAGNPDADVLFIGEAPGKNEDIQGLPFVGAAGTFLNEMLDSINLRREQVYITNIVKYRPPNNRDPLPDEKKAFWPYLVRQLQVIQPLIVVTLGRHSMEYFLPGYKISEIHGQPKRIRVREWGGADGSLGGEASGAPSVANQKESTKNIVILPLFHPAAALYNGGLRETLIQDFQTIPEALRLIRNDKVKE